MKEARDEIKHHWEHEGRWTEVGRLPAAAYWRNFTVKYPETGEMHSTDADGQPPAG